MQYKGVRYSPLLGITRNTWRIVVCFPDGTSQEQTFVGGKTAAEANAQQKIDRWLPRPQVNFGEIEPAK